MSTRPEYAVEVKDVAKTFGRLRALDGISLRIRRGEVYGLLGPNGSGKTTLIRCLVGLVQPNAGTVTVLGRRIPDLGVLARVGYMTQAMAAEGITIVVSSHVMDEADRCQRLGLIRFGKLLAEGSPQELRRMARVDRLEDAFLKLSAASAAGSGEGRP